MIGTHVHLARDVISILHRGYVKLTHYSPPNYCDGHQVNWSSQKVVDTKVVDEPNRGGTMDDQAATLIAVNRVSTSKMLWVMRLHNS